jgi:hypothetical protein
LGRGLRGRETVTRTSSGGDDTVSQGDSFRHRLLRKTAGIREIVLMGKITHPENLVKNRLADGRF